MWIARYGLRTAVAATLFLGVASLSAITVSPTNPTVKEGESQQFTSSVPATWAASCSRISSAGLFTASLYPGHCNVTATAIDGSGSVSTTVTLVSPIMMTPVSAKTPEGRTQQFTASVPVTWRLTTSCGTITSSGLYTATATPGTFCGIEGIASSGPKYTVYGYDHVLASVGFSISPLNPTVSEGQTQQFTASAPATWTTSCSRITSGGLFTAGLYPGKCTVTATAQTGGQTASTVATLVSPIVMTPDAVSTPQGQTQQFTASIPVTWRLTTSCGTITSSGLYTATAAPGTYCGIEGIASSGTKYTAYGYDRVTPPIAFSITPLNPALSEGGTQQFTANATVTWSAGCGAISSAGLYQAPLAPGSCRITATNGGGQTATTTATVKSPITITPASVSTPQGGTQQFTASVSVSWSASCGAISGSGLFTAPGTAGSCTITATASQGTRYTAHAIDMVAGLNYTTWMHDNMRTGLQAQESVLTPANVNATHFGVSWSAVVDSPVWGQPLYLNAIMVKGAVHNVVFVATSNDSAYAFDGDTGAQLWKTNFLSSGVIPGIAISTQEGVLGTPVIDPDSGTLYMVAETREGSAETVVHRLHALDVATGQEKSGVPVVTIAAPEFTDATQLQRPGLLLANGRVYIAFGSIGDKGLYHGFVFAYDAGTLALDDVWSDTPSGAAQGGIWMAGASPAADADGNVYVSTGNGHWDGTNNFGESVVKLSPTLQVLDYFSPYNQAKLSNDDVDLGSGGVLLVPDQNGEYPHEIIACGKPTPIYVLNRDHMGEVGTTQDNIVQRLDNQLGGATGKNAGQPCWSNPAIWQQSVYFAANNDVLKMFTLDPATGQLSNAPVSKGAFAYLYPGAQPVVSSNGGTNGIVWTVDRTTGTLRANDAMNVSKVLYVSARVDYGVTWEVPTVVNGHVYVGMQTKVVAFSSH